jgi:hypothetical protein
MVSFSACVKKPEFPIEPFLEYKGMSKNTMNQGFLNSDSLTIFLYFTDGDGDIGFEDTDTLQNLFIIDSRTGNIAESIKIPRIESGGIGKGISADMELQIYTTCCLFPGNIPPCSVVEAYPRDSLKYRIHLIDRAGNVSNAVETDYIYLNCN